MWGTVSISLCWSQGGRVSSGGSGVSGSVIRFLIKDNRVRFDIDTAAAAATGVTISPTLLGLAITIKAGS